jgi:hypothetical protein
MLARGRNLGEDAGDIVEGVDALGLCGARIVSGALGGVEHLVGSREQLQAGQADGRSHPVPGSAAAVAFDRR